MNPTAATDAAQQTPDRVNGSSPHRVSQTEGNVDLLARLDADLLHPARLAGPHAWHPWGLTRSPPTDDSVRLVVPAGPNAAAQIERITASLHDQLTSPTWPPGPQFDVSRNGEKLTCDLHGTNVAEIRVCAASRCLGIMRIGTDHRDHARWPILAEHPALNDRIDAIDRARPTADDLADLAHWVARRARNLTAVGGRHEMHAWLLEHFRLAPDSSDRLATIVGLCNELEVSPSALGCLEDVLRRTAHFRAAGASRQRPFVSIQ